MPSREGAGETSPLQNDSVTPTWDSGAADLQESTPVLPHRLSLKTIRPPRNPEIPLRMATEILNVPVLLISVSEVVHRTCELDYKAVDSVLGRRVPRWQ